MKKTVTIKCFLFFFVFAFIKHANAQSYSLNSSNIFVINMGLNDVQYDGVEFTNNSSQTLILNWVKIEVDTVPGSTFDMCASGECFIGVPDTGSFHNFPTLPGQIGWLKMHFWTGNNSGTSKARVYIYETSAPNNGDTLTFILNINQSNSINKNIQDKIVQLYPNPVSEELFFDFKNTGDECKAEIINCLGQKVHSTVFHKSENNKINIRNYSPGVYFIHFTNNKTNKIIQTEKIIIK